jgi:hypothetical protein
MTLTLGCLLLALVAVAFVVHTDHQDKKRALMWRQTLEIELELAKARGRNRALQHELDER